MLTGNYIPKGVCEQNQHLDLRLKKCYIFKACVEFQKEYLLVGSEWEDLKRLKCPFHGKGSLKLWKHQRTLKTADMSGYSLMLKHKVKVLMSSTSAVMEMLLAFVYWGLNP